MVDAQVSRERSDGGCWYTGTCDSNGEVYEFFALAFDEPSQFGLPSPEYATGGTVGKLNLFLNEQQVFAYDRYDVEGDYDEYVDVIDEITSWFDGC